MEEYEVIRIFHMNDVHSHFAEWPKIVRFLKRQKQLASERGETCLVLDIGDHVDRSHPYTEATAGKGNVALLNDAAVDFVTIGNNEGITLSHEALDTLYDEATFQVIVANVKTKEGDVPHWASESSLAKTNRGTTIGIVGVTAPYEVFYAQLGWAVEEPYGALRRAIDQVKEESDLIVCLSHLGINDDRKVAETFPEIDVLFGGHTHHLFEEGEWANETLLTSTGKYGTYIGEVVLTMDRQTKRVASRKAIVHRVAQLEEKLEDSLFSPLLIQRGEQALEVPVFYNRSPLKSNLFGESELALRFGRALIQATGADCAMFNAGIFLGHLQKGIVTKRDLHALLPHPINVAVVTIDGALLLHVYEKTKSPEWPKLEVRGLGFRGTLMGKILFERLFENANGDVFVGNERIRHGETYTLATLDMFTFGYFFPELSDCSITYQMPDLIRDVFGSYSNNL